MTISGTFKNVNNVDIEVCIYNSKSADLTTYLIGDDVLDDTNHFAFAADGVSITHNFSSLFEPIITGEATITLVSNIWVGDMLYANDLGDIVVYIKKGNTLEFVGYVEPRTYSQPIDNKINTIDIHCIDWLTACEDIKLSTLSRYSYNELTMNCKYLTLLNTLKACNLYLSQFTFPNEVITTNLLIDANVQNMLELQVHESLWLGDEEDDERTISEIITEICKYLNCRIVSPNGQISYMLLNDASTNYTQLFNCTTRQVETSSIVANLPVNDIANENISLDDINSQIGVTCKLDKIDDVIEQPLKDENLNEPYKNMQLYMTEYKMKYDSSRGDWSICDKNNRGCFVAFINDEREHWGDPLYDWSYHDTEFTRWYIKYVNNNKWQFNNNFNKFYEENKVIDANSNYIKQYYPMFDMNCNYELYINNDSGNWNPENYDYDIQDTPIISHTANLNTTYIHPYIISFGKGETKKHPDISKERTPSFNNYLIIPCPESWLSTSTNILGYISESEAFSWIDSNLAKYDPTAGGTPIINYKSNKTMNLSPADDETINYIVFSGNMKLLPSVRCTTNTKPFKDKDGIYNFRGVSTEVSTEVINKYTYDQYSIEMNGYPFLPVTSSNRAENPEYYYYQKYYTKTYPTTGNIYPAHQYGDTGYPDPNSFMFWGSPQLIDPDSRKFRNAQLWMPDVNVYAKQYPYQGTYVYSNSLWTNWYLDYCPTLLCTMRVGNKYLKETTTNYSDNRTFEWTTDNTATFTLGIGLLRGSDCIIGESQKELWNNVTPELNLEKVNGTAIPITKADALNGDVEFNIIGPFNAIIDEAGHYKCYDWFRNTSGGFAATDVSLLNHLRGIQIEKFECTIHTNNAKNAVPNDDNDICYLSIDTGLKTAELKEVNFDITTALNPEEAYELGVASGVSYNNPLNTDGTLYMVESPYKPEEKYVNTLFDLYSTPKKIIEYNAEYSSELLDMYKGIYSCSLLQRFDSENFNTMLTSNEVSLYTNRIKIQLREI